MFGNFFDDEIEKLRETFVQKMFGLKILFYNENWVKHNLSLLKFFLFSDSKNDRSQTLEKINASDADLKLHKFA